MLLTAISKHGNANSKRSEVTLHIHEMVCVKDGRYQVSARIQGIWYPHTPVGQHVKLSIHFGRIWQSLFIFFDVKRFTQTPKEELVDIRKNLSRGDCECLESWRFLLN